MSDKFSIGKFLDFSPLAFAKVFGLALKAGVVIMLLLGILWVKNLLLPQKPAVENITVSEGGKVYINEQKRRLEYFVGGFGDRERFGIFGGVKW